mmetsp:Transcript_10044/g.22172  ORF Transcript_10044/g.22172 Transcript_10044/m.22172 type:complete len:129 (+) Transcript_10044:1823-2209(+)
MHDKPPLFGSGTMALPFKALLPIAFRRSSSFLPIDIVLQAAILERRRIVDPFVAQPRSKLDNFELRHTGRSQPNAPGRWRLRLVLVKNNNNNKNQFGRLFPFSAEIVGRRSGEEGLATLTVTGGCMFM